MKLVSLNCTSIFHIFYLFIYTYKVKDITLECGSHVSYNTQQFVKHSHTTGILKIRSN